MTFVFQSFQSLSFTFQFSCFFTLRFNYELARNAHHLSYSQQSGSRGRLSAEIYAMAVHSNYELSHNSHRPSYSQQWLIWIYLSSMYRVIFFTGTPQFQHQKENPPSSQSRPFLVTGFTRTAALIGWLAIFFLVLKLGVTSEKNHPV